MGDGRQVTGDGDWRLQRLKKIGDWRLEIGDWRLEIGDWRLEIGYWILDIGERAYGASIYSGSIEYPRPGG
jgi:hypothetical protein